MTSSLTMNLSTEADAIALYEMSVDSIADRISVMRHQESSSSYYPVDYLSRQPTAIVDNEDSRISRSKMCQWCYQILNACSLSRHAVSRSMNYLDRFIASNHCRARRSLSDRREYQLAAMTTMYISIKLHEPLSLDAPLLAEISAGCYTTEEILNMERDILWALQWKMNAPTSSEFACLLLGLLDPEGYGHDLDVVGSLLDVTAFQCELATGDYDLSNGCMPSEVALGSVLNGLEGVSQDILSNGARYAYLKRLCEVLKGSGGIDMIRVGHVQARLRRLFCENSGVDFKPSKQHDILKDETVTSTSGRCSDNDIVRKTAPMKSSCQAKCVSPVR